MKISRNRIAYYDDVNSAFNQNQSVTIDEILQTQSEAPIGYVMSTGMVGWRPHLHLHVDKAHVIDSAVLPTRHNHMQYDMRGLGDYERVFLSSLAWGRYSTYVVVGEMGSGKTAALRCVLARLGEPLDSTCSACQKLKPSIISINYNKGARVRNAEAVLAQFRRRLRDQLRSHLKTLLAASGVLNDVTSYLATNHGDEILVSLDSFMETVIGTDGWKNAITRHRVIQLMKWLDDNCDDIPQHIERLMALIGLIHRKRRGHGGPFILVFDNIDSVLPEAQYDLLLDVLAYQEIANVKAVIVLRQSTFAGLRAQRSYSFGVIRHCGPKPSLVLRKRLEYYSTNWTNEESLNKQRQPVREAILSRCAYILGEMDGRGGISEFLDALCGDSIRLGLYAAIRLFINNQIPWNRNPAHRNDALRGLLYGMHSEMHQRDNTVYNIFVNGQGGFSLINIRILQLVVAFDKHPQLRTCANLRAILKAVGGWSGQQICDALNHMMLIRRPLIWADACARFDGPRELDQDLEINVTNAGSRYLTILARRLEYVQECLVSCTWPDDAGVPEVVQYHMMEERFEVLRRCLEVMNTVDTLQVTRYLHFAPKHVDVKIVPRLISCDILSAVSESVYAIMSASSQVGDVYDQKKLEDQYKNWLSTIVNAYNRMDALKIQAGREQMEAVMHTYQQKLRI